MKYVFAMYQITGIFTLFAVVSLTSTLLCTQRGVETNRWKSARALFPQQESFLEVKHGNQPRLGKVVNTVRYAETVPRGATKRVLTDVKEMYTLCFFIFSRESTHFFFVFLSPSFIVYPSTSHLPYFSHILSLPLTLCHPNAHNMRIFLAFCTRRGQRTVHLFAGSKLRSS